MPGIEQTYYLIVTYLKGLLSDRQRHDLEKDIMQDAFEEEAFEGLTRLSSGELESDMDHLVKRLENRVVSTKNRDLKILLRLAAGIILLAGLGSILYFILKTPSSDLFLVENKKEKPPVSVSPSPTAVPLLTDTGKKDKRPAEKKSSLIVENSAGIAENRSEPKKEQSAPPTATAGERKTDDGLAAPEQSAAIPLKATTKLYMSRSPAKIVAGTVVDSEGETLPGVSIAEKGSNNKTITDKNGWFSIPVSDTSARLAVNYIGYKTLELAAGKSPEEKITLLEDPVALNEVVVTAYGSQKRSNAITSSSTTIESENDGNENATEHSLLIKPLPPGGSLNDFKKWVTDRLDFNIFKSYPGKQRILVNLIVHIDGTIGDIRIRDTVPAAMATEFNKVIAQSPRWNPALRDGNPVEAKVAIRFIITVE